MYKHVCCEGWGHNINFTRTLIVILVRRILSIIYIYLWFALHVVCVIKQTGGSDMKLFIKTYLKADL